MVFKSIVVLLHEVQCVCLFGFIVLNATFNNISVISWRSVLLVEETVETHRPLARH